MSTEKRQRQRENRRLRLEADAAAAKQQANRRRVKLIGSAAVVVAVALVVLAWVQSRDNSETVTDQPDPVTTVPNDETTEPADDIEPLDDIDEATAELEQSEETADFDTNESEDITPENSTSDETREDTAVNDTMTNDAVPDGCPDPAGGNERIIDFDGPQPMCIDVEASYTAVFDTSEGEMRFDLTADNTPLTVNNFVTLARWGYYDGTRLFRTDPSIDIIQGGSPHTNSASDPGPGYTIADEPTFETNANGALVGPYRYQPGQLVMARSAGPDSGSAQFFITTGPNASALDSQGTYVVFGQTDDAGLEVARSIMGLHVATGSMGGAPSRDVTVNSVTIEQSSNIG